ncbi:MAG: hypothetical protein ACW99A_18215, partial [Candidatus Kariarchaeaceae archaeon]
MKLSDKRTCLVLFYIIILFVILQPIQSSGHNTSEYNYLNDLVFSPDSKVIKNQQLFTNVNQSFHKVSLAQINKSFVFDPIAVNLEFNHSINNYHNNS